MQSLTIHAASAETARAMAAALYEFHGELREVDGRTELVIAFGDGDREIVRVLNALSRYVAERADGPARIELGGHEYAMHPQ